MNKIEYKELMAFHPGYYIADIIDDMEITQEEFAMRLGTTPKTISKLVSGQISLSNDLAQKLSMMLGTGIDVWLNLQKTYDEKRMTFEREKMLDQQINTLNMIDYKYFVDNGFLEESRKPEGKIINLCSFLKVSNLSVFEEEDFLVNFRSGIKTVESKNLVNARVWLQTAINIAMETPAKEFNAIRLKQYIPEIRGMTVQAPNIFLPRLKEIFNDCGVSFVLLPHLKNSGINGAVKWIGPDKVILAMNDRRNFADTFWFSLFHEIKHILQQKTKTIFISSTRSEMIQTDCRLEVEADGFAQTTLIPETSYSVFKQRAIYSDVAIKNFANKISIHPGIVAGRLQHDGLIAQNRCIKLKEKYRIVVPRSNL